jgi:hypothetical protein
MSGRASVRMKPILLAALLLAACATAPSPAPETPVLQDSELDADPNSLQIEIGRYSALLGQVVEHTGVAYDHPGRDTELEGPDALMMQLTDAVADYNAVRAALCASKPGDTFTQIRTHSCTRSYRPAWPAGSVDYLTVARRSNAAGQHIIALWSEVCNEAERIRQPGEDEDMPVCPME